MLLQRVGADYPTGRLKTLRVPRRWRRDYSSSSWTSSTRRLHSRRHNPRCVFSTSMSKAKLRKWRRSPRGRPTAQGQHFETRRRRSRRRPAPAESTTAWHAWSLDGRRCWPRSRRETPYSPRLTFARRRPFRTTRGGARGLILCVNRRPPRAVARLTVSCRRRVSHRDRDGLLVFFVCVVLLRGAAAAFFLQICLNPRRQWWCWQAALHSISFLTA